MRSKGLGARSKTMLSADDSTPIQRVACESMTLKMPERLVEVGPEAHASELRLRVWMVHLVYLSIRSLPPSIMMGSPILLIPSGPSGESHSSKIVSVRTLRTEARVPAIYVQVSFGVMKIAESKA